MQDSLSPAGTHNTPMVYTAFARMPRPLLDLKCPLDLTVTSKPLMAEQRGRWRYVHNKPQADQQGEFLLCVRSKIQSPNGEPKN